MVLSAYSRARSMPIRMRRPARGVVISPKPHRTVTTRSLAHATISALSNASAFARASTTGGHPVTMATIQATDGRGACHHTGRGAGGGAAKDLDAPCRPGVRKERRVCQNTRRSKPGQSSEFQLSVAEKLKVFAPREWPFPRGYLFQSRKK